MGIYFKMVSVRFISCIVLMSSFYLSAGQTIYDRPEEYDVAMDFNQMNQKVEDTVRSVDFLNKVQEIERNVEDGIRNATGVQVNRSFVIIASLAVFASIVCICCCCVCCHRRQ